MRIQLHDWLQARVDDPLYQQLIWWQDKQKKKLAIHWKHASFSDYENGDSVLFKSWAIQNNRYDAMKEDTAEEIKRWKTNFRCALASATNIIALNEDCSSKGKSAYKVYQILDRPDPKKVEYKKLSNRKAAKSKQKPQNQKRGYYSRLSKPRVKAEPFSRSQMRSIQPTKKSNKSKKAQDSALPYTQPFYPATKQEPMDYGFVKTKVEPRDHYKCIEMPNGDLPTTLDELHEDEDHDGGYCSGASDCASYASSSRSSITSEPYHHEEKMARLAPVETLLSDRCHSAADTFYDEIFYVDEGHPTDLQETIINDWGQEVICEETSGPNVTVQRFADKSINIYDYNQQHNLNQNYQSSYQILTHGGAHAGIYNHNSDMSGYCLTDL